MAAVRLPVSPSPCKLPDGFGWGAGMGMGMGRGWEARHAALSLGASDAGWEEALSCSTKVRNAVTAGSLMSNAFSPSGGN